MSKGNGIILHNVRSWSIVWTINTMIYW